MTIAQTPAKQNSDLDEDGYPTREGIYLCRRMQTNERWEKIDVYEHPLRGLCVWNPLGGEGDLDNHISVQFTNLEFGVRIGDLGPTEDHDLI